MKIKNHADHSLASIHKYTPQKEYAGSFDSFMDVCDNNNAYWNHFDTEGDMYQEQPLSDKSLDLKKHGLIYEWYKLYTYTGK